MLLDLNQHHHPGRNGAAEKIIWLESSFLTYVLAMCTDLVQQLNNFTTACLYFILHCNINLCYDI